MSSESAKKAWVTRRKNAAAKKTSSQKTLQSILTKPYVGPLHGVPIFGQKSSSGHLTPGAAAKAGASAKKAWATRRKQEAEDEAGRLEAIRILDELIAQRESQENK